MSYKNTEVDFWNRVDKSGGPDTCWPWLARKNDRGYGVFRFKEKDRRAHRLAYIFVFGEPLLTKPEIQHLCNNSFCCNPNHLKSGTHQENMDYMVESGRTNPATGDRHGLRLRPERVAHGQRNGRSTHPEKILRGDQHPFRLHPELVARGDRHGWYRHPETIPRGESHGMSKLIIDKIYQIFQLRKNGWLQREIAEKFDVTQALISLICSGKGWKHLQAYAVNQ